MEACFLLSPWKKKEREREHTVVNKGQRGVEWTSGDVITQCRKRDLSAKPRNTRLVKYGTSPRAPTLSLRGRHGSPARSARFRSELHEAIN